MKSKKDPNFKLVTKGERYSLDGESCTKFYVFKEGPSDEDVLEHLEKEGVPVEGYSINADYSPTGRWFAREARVIHKPGRIIVRQSWGLDV